MNFLWIKQILAIIFILKIIFYLFPWIFFLLDWATITGETGASSVNVSKTQSRPSRVPRVDSNKEQGLLCKKPGRSGIVVS
jgi:hypothetical protein